MSSPTSLQAAKPSPGERIDPIAQFKQMQKESWVHFAPLEALTTPAAARLAQFAGIQGGQRVLDVGCGTGVVAITAARLGASATALDLTPELLARARENAEIAGVDVEFHEGDAEHLPFADAQFDAVLSQFAHMFAPRPEVAITEMLRVLKPDGMIAFSTWPPELLVGRTMELRGRYMPPPPAGVPSPVLWGDPNVVRQRLGNAVRNIEFHRQTMLVPALSPQHLRLNVEKTAGPMVKMVDVLSTKNPEALQEFRAEFDSIVAQYHENNVVHQDYLMTRAIKVSLAP
jgi:SAM-dependent methyltransferase